MTEAIPVIFDVGVHDDDALITTNPIRRILAPLFMRVDGQSRGAVQIPWPESLASDTAGIDELVKALEVGRTGREVCNSPHGVTVRAVLSVFAPRTGTLAAITDESPEWSMSSNECFDSARAEFSEFADCPQGNEPFGAVAKLWATMNLMKRGRDVQANLRHAGVRHAWNFKFRTTDHSWLTGVILRTEPPAKTRGREQVQFPGPDESGGLRWNATTALWSKWFGTSALQCRVRECKQ